MRIWQAHELGEPADVMRLESTVAPTAGPGEALVDVHAVGLNFPDVLQLRGGYQVKPKLPFTVGGEIAGEITAVGEGVTQFKPGDRVASIGSGGLVEQAAIPAARLMPISATIPAAKAAALLVNYSTTYFALHDRAHLQAGETVLVHAGAGGVGSAAIQIARAAGARVIATAGGPDKVRICEQLGADVAIDYTTEDLVARVKHATNDRGVDVIYDPVGGDIFDQSRRVLGWDGRYLIIGFTSGRIADAPTNHILLKNYSIVGVHWGAAVARRPDLLPRTFATLVAMYDAGGIDPLIFEAPLPFADAATALTKLATRQTCGKVIIDPRL